MACGTPVVTSNTRRSPKWPVREQFSSIRLRRRRSPTPCCASKPIRRSAPNRSPTDSNGSNSSLGKHGPALAGALRIARQIERKLARRPERRSGGRNRPKRPIKKKALPFLFRFRHLRLIFHEVLLHAVQIPPAWPFMPRISSIVLPVMLFGVAGRKPSAEQPRRLRMRARTFCLASAAFTPPASLSNAPSPPMCMK